MIANERGTTVTVEFRRGMSALAFGCLTTKGLGFSPTAVRTEGATATLAFGPLDAEQALALEDLLRAYAGHPGHRDSLAGWVRRDG